MRIYHIFSPTGVIGLGIGKKQLEAYMWQITDTEMAFRGWCEKMHRLGLVNRKIVEYRNKFTNNPYFKEIEIMCDKHQNMRFIRIGCTIWNASAWHYFQKRGVFDDFVKYKKAFIELNAAFEVLHSSLSDRAMRVSFDAIQEQNLRF